MLPAPHPMRMLSSICQSWFFFGIQDGAEWGHALKEGRGRQSRHAVEWLTPQQAYRAGLILVLSSSRPTRELLHSLFR